MCKVETVKRFKDWEIFNRSKIEMCDVVQDKQFAQKPFRTFILVKKVSIGHLYERDHLEDRERNGISDQLISRLFCNVQLTNSGILFVSSLRFSPRLDFYSKIEAAGSSESQQPPTNVHGVLIQRSQSKLAKILPEEDIKIHPKSPNHDYNVQMCLIY